MKPELDQIKHRAGREAWEGACRIAWRMAPGTGKSGRESVPLPDFVYSVADWICDDMGLPPVDRIALLAAVYERMPCFALLIIGPTRCAGDCPQAMALWKARVRGLLSGEDDALADPVAYWLWCGPFEDTEEVAESWWRTLTNSDPPARLVERLLEHSGPVSYPLKAELYQRLLSEERWHPLIFKSLCFSRQDYYGQIDIDDAHRVFRRLRLPSETEGADIWMQAELWVR